MKANQQLTGFLKKTLKWKNSWFPINIQKIVEGVALKADGLKLNLEF